MLDRRSGRRSTLIAGLVALVPLLMPIAYPGTSHHRAHLRPFHAQPTGRTSLGAPLDTAACEQAFGIACYSPRQLQHAYGVDALGAQGIDGQGITIALIVSYGSPTIAHDLSEFDRAFGLPDPPSLRVIAPVGQSPPFDGLNQDMEGWAEEATLDVEAAHLMAPKANLLLVTEPVSETEGIQGFPQIMGAMRYLFDHNLADIISLSLGATEETFDNPRSILDLRETFARARQQRVTLLAATGDDGATNPRPDSSCCYPCPVVAWPASDPLVTAVGGTQLHLTAAGDRQQPDNVWNDPQSVMGGRPNDLTTAGAAGGGVSSVFSRPSFQDRVAGIVGGQRGVPDVSLSAAMDGGLIAYWSFPSPLTTAGYHVIGGTSEATPLFAGLVALSNQVRGGREGWLGPALYRMARQSSSGIVDVTRGDNHFTFLDDQGSPVTVPGYHATPGYDLASGLGTIEGPRFVRALAAEPPG